MIKEDMYKIGETKMYFRYYDKNGNEIKDGDFIKLGGDIKKVYASDDGELCTDATNPLWLLDGRAYPCQYGLYPLTASECNACEIVESEEPHTTTTRKWYETTITLTFTSTKEKVLNNKYITALIDSDDCISYNIKEEII